MKKLNQGDIRALASAIAEKLDGEYLFKDLEHRIVREKEEIVPKIAQAITAYFGSS